MSNSEIIIYQTNDGQTKIDVRLQDETVWLSQAQMSKLFQKDRSVIGKHIKNIFDEGELNENEVCANFAHTIFRYKQMPAASNVYRTWQWKRERFRRNRMFSG